MNAISNPPDLWKDVIDYHFKQHGNAILETVQEWIKKEDIAEALRRAEMQERWDYIFSGGNNGRLNMRCMLAELQTRLSGYGATFKITSDTSAVDSQRSRDPTPSESSHSQPPPPPQYGISPYPHSSLYPIPSLPTLPPPSIPLPGNPSSPFSTMPSTLLIGPPLENTGSAGRGGQSSTHIPFGYTGVPVSTRGRGFGGSVETRGGRGGPALGVGRSQYDVDNEPDPLNYFPGPEMLKR